MMAGCRLLTTADAVGGVWQYALDLARALAPLGTDTVLALLGPSPSEAQRAEADAVPGLRLIETGLPLDWLAQDEAEVRATARTVAALAAAEQVDLVQLNQAALAAEPMPVPAIVMLHSCVASWWNAVEGGVMPPDFRWQTDLVRAGLARADRIACPTAAFAEEARRLYRLPVAPHVVHNGRRTVAVERCAVHDFAFTAGRLWDRGKDLATLDRAAARLAIPVKAAGPLASPSGEAVRLDHVHALGRMDDAGIAACLGARPVFVSAARYEPFGLAVLEAAQAGCPLVLSDIPTFRELWDGAATFVTPGDDAGFARAIEALVGDEARRLADGQAAAARARRYTPAAMAAGVAALHRDALRPRAAA